MFPFYKLLMLWEITSFLYFLKLIFLFILHNRPLFFSFSENRIKILSPGKSPGKFGKEELVLHLKIATFIDAQVLPLVEI